MSWSWFRRSLFEFGLLTSLLFEIILWFELRRVRIGYYLLIGYKSNCQDCISLTQLHIMRLWCDNFNCQIKLDPYVAFTLWLLHIGGRHMIEYAVCFMALLQVPNLSTRICDLSFLLEEDRFRTKALPPGEK